MQIGYGSLEIIIIAAFINTLYGNVLTNTGTRTWKNPSVFHGRRAHSFVEQNCRAFLFAQLAFDRARLSQSLTDSLVSRRTASRRSINNSELDESSGYIALEVNII